MARIGAASALVAVLCVLLLADVFLPSYDPNLPACLALLAAILTLLGLEAHDLWRGG